MAGEPILNNTTSNLLQSGSGSGPVFTPEDSTVRTEAGVTSIQGTTDFVDDANVVTRDDSANIHMDDMISRMNDSQDTEATLLDFLAKPIVLSKGTFNITDTYSFFNSYSMPYAAFQSANSIVWRQKLAGYFGIRMDLVFKIVINANRFQQGRYILGWTPMTGASPTTSNLKQIAINNMHNATLIQRTTVPHVEFDLASDTSAELVIPYASVKTFWPLNSILSSTDRDMLGFLNLYPYSPMVSPAGSTVASYTIYCSMTNIRLFGASSAQAGNKVLARKGISDKEVSNSDNGPISGVANAVSKGFKEFSSIPFIGEYAKGISWVSDRIAKTATMFGFSKPTQGDSSTKMQILVASNHTTVDGDSDARALSYLSKPGVVMMEGLSGTAYDEMDFSYITRKYAWFRTFTMSLSNPADYTLDSIYNSPGASLIMVGGAASMPPVCFVQAFFAYWRGSMKYKIKIVKTEFHSGRIAVSFFPTDVDTFTGNSNYVNRMIIDIRDTSEFEFIIPYMASAPWYDFAYSTGVIVFSVVDPLVAPATVSSTITFLVEVAGGDDIEFSVPRTTSMNPQIVVPQSGGNENMLVSMTLGSANIIADPNLSSATAIGDKVSNFRTYLKRYSDLTPNNTLATNTANLLNSNLVYMLPDAICGLPTVVPSNYYNADAYSIIASCYGIIRGGIRIRDVVNRGMLAVDANRSSPGLFKISTRGVVNGLNSYIMQPLPDNFIDQTNQHIIFQDMSTNPVISIEIPQYTSTYGRCKTDIFLIQGGSTTATGNNYTPWSSQTNLSLSIAAPTKAITGLEISNYQVLHNIFRAVSDDADFSVFISVPPMQLRTVVGQTGMR